jgi:glycosyltransferase involved in cell wall biosynthesis
MQIAFDAKRAFHNGTGLGHYSRTIIESLARIYPEHDYWLLNPKPSASFSMQGSQLHEVRPTQWLHTVLSATWRSHWCKQWLVNNNIDLYHGLSHELPFGIHRTGIPTVVTMHDLIPERYPEQYGLIDRKIYHQKFRYACTTADRIIAISEQTKADIIDFYKIEEKKIRVCYQSCDPRFYQPVTEQEKERIRQKYSLPTRFFLSVGSIIERKNLLQACKAMDLLSRQLDIPLVVIGNGGSYKKKVKAYIEEKGLQHKIIFLSENPIATQDPDFKRAHDFPAIYQSAIALLYPSYFEGFGIPVLEALCSKVPVITSNRSCLPEAGGPGAYYVDPDSAEAIAAAMISIVTDTDKAAQQIQAGWQYAQEFTCEKTAAKVMQVYQELAR